MTQRIGAVVDACSTGRYLADGFGRHGITCVHVQSSSALPTRLVRGCDLTTFRANVVHRSNVSETARWLRQRGVEFVVAGAESGVELADALSEELGLATNGVKWSAARRNKAAMAEALRQHGLRAPEGFLAASQAQAAAWAADQARYPVVVKPVASAGTEDVRFCASAEAVCSAVAAILNKTNRLGLVNRHALVQEYLEGAQYVVNTLTVAGEHYVAEIWADRRLPVADAANIYDFEELLPRNGDLQDRIARYACAVLDSLHVRWGPGHIEIIDTIEGPVLVEAATRMAGMIIPDAVEHAVGHSHVSLTVECYANPELVAALPGTVYRKRTNMVTVSLIADRSGVVCDNRGLRRIAQLPSYFGMVVHLDPGSRVRQTIDLETSPGMVCLLHADYDQVFRDYRAIRRWEKSHELYTVSRD